MGMILPLLCIAAQATAQDAPALAPPPPALSDPDAAPGAAPVILAIGANETRMTVPVSIAGVGPYPFIVDTGAQRSVISRQLATMLRLQPGCGARLTAMTGTSNVATVLIPALSVSPIGTRPIDAPVLDTIDLGAPGLLGIDMLQDHAVTIDFDTRTMAVTPSRKRSVRDHDAPGEIVIRARSLFGQLVVTDAYYGSHRVRMILDTGTVVTLGNEALRRQLSRQRRVVRPIELISVTGGILRLDYTTIDQIAIGDLRIQDLPIAFADAAPFKAFGLEKKPAIMLGMDALRMFRRVDIDFANRQVRLVLPKAAPRS